MCGIAGIVNYKKEVLDEIENIKNMRNSMKHRGPDAQGCFNDKHISLMHARLSIMDIEKGKQPMFYKNYVLSYNGELYGFQKLKEELIELGYTFETTCDSEVLLKGYVEFKEKILDKINGIYAFAIWNIIDDSLFIARDRLGVKPLFYSLVDDYFLFASEIKTLLAHSSVQPIIDMQGLKQLLLLGPAREQGDCAVRDINELKPAQYAIIDKNGMHTFTYWRLNAKQHKDNLQETTKKIHDLVVLSTQEQLASDVGLCCFLSGGLDSSILSKIASDKYKNLDTFSIEYEGNETYFTKSVFQPNRDNDYIEMMSDAIHSNHTQFIVSQNEVVDELYSATIAKDLPGMAEVDSSLLWFSKQVKKYHSVALSGEGADEILGGYPWYYNDNVLYRDTFPWTSDIQIRLSCLKDGLLNNPQEYIDKKYYDCIKDVPYLASDSAKDRRMREMFYLNMRYFMQTLLERKDRMSMHNALEVRVPFLDYRIVEYAFNMPWRYKSLNGREKGILREAFKEELPKEIITRKKSPYPKSHNPAYTTKVIETLRSILKKDCLLNKIIDEEKIEQLIKNIDHIETPWYGQLMKGPQILAYFIQMHYFFEKYKIKLIETNN